MPKHVDRIIVDTNIWINFLINNDFQGLDELILDGSVTIVCSLELSKEFHDVVNRPKFKRYFRQKEVSKLSELIDSFGEMAVVREQSGNLSGC
jgi:uncharacterized protein